jgi:rRNA-processing protein FCF1
MELLIIIILLAIVAETTYLSANSVRKNRRTALAPVFVDTSVLIDGRIIPIAESGFLTRPLYIPRSVVGELQFLADNADAEKRSRARHGLDVINQLQAITSIETRIFPDGVKAEEGVDNRLLKLAKKHNGALCTIDYNLNKVAVVEGLEVLNVNELAKSLRMAYLPGERAMIELTQKGNDQHQAVGHLEDGTMVVVEHAFKHIGTAVEVEFIRSLQTAAGKMMFARLAHPEKQFKPQSVKPSVHLEAKKVQKKGTAPIERKVRSQKTQPSASAPSIQADAQVVTPRRTAAPARKQDRSPQAKRQSKPHAARRNAEDSLVELANQ